MVPFQTLLPHTKVTTFFFLRCFLGFTEALAELLLYNGICNRLGNGIGRYYALITTCGTGMFIASCAFLPSSFSMTMNVFALAAWLHNWQFASVAFTALSTLLGWPFAAVLGLPIVFSMIVEKPRQWGKFCLYSVIAGLSICALMTSVDSHLYGKRVLAPLNIVWYNIFTGHGPNLYGTAPLSYYIINCFLNWNIVFPMALLALPITALTIKINTDPNEKPDFNNATSFACIHASLFLWMIIFFSQPHKEERFLFPIYPLLALSAAIVLNAIERILLKLWPRKSSIAYSTVAVLLTVFALVSCSRTVSLYRNYHAPADTYMALNERLIEKFKDNQLTKTPQITVCIGKEWHRFPSSFFLPTILNSTTIIKVEFIKSEFRGLLPKHYEDLTVPQVTRLTYTN